MTSSENSTGLPGGKRRDCPALGSVISSADCGAKRNSLLPCPPTCPWNPLGTEAYDLWLGIDLKLIQKGMAYTMTFASRRQGRKWLDAGTIPGDDAVRQQELAMAYMFYMVMSRERDAQGRSGWERWEAEDWTGLNNDERTLCQYRRQTFATVLEVQRVLDSQRILCVDVLTPESKPFLLFDRTMSSQLVRFDRLLTFVTHYPHFSRPAFYPTAIPLDLWSDWLSNVQQFWQAERQTRPDLTLQDWLAENFGEATAATEELLESRRRAMLDQLDLYQCVATYRMQTSRAEIEALLRSKPDFEEQQDPLAEPPYAQPLALFRWLRRGGSKALEDHLAPAFRHDNPEQEGFGLVGNVRVYDSTVQVDTLQKQHFEFAKELMAQYFGPRLTLERETVVDVAKIMRDQLDRQDGAPEEPLEEWQQDEDALEEPDLPQACYVVEFRLKLPSVELLERLRRHPAFVEDTEDTDDAARSEPNPESPHPVFSWYHAVEAGEEPYFIGGAVLHPERLAVLCFDDDSAEIALEELPQVLDHAIEFERRTILDPTKDAVDQFERTTQERDYLRALLDAKEKDLPLPDSESFGLEPGYDPLAKAPEVFAEPGEESWDESPAGTTPGPLPTGASPKPGPSPEAMRAVLERAHANHYRKFLRNPVPMLLGQTPLQAAQDPAMRPTLIELMKLHLNGIARRNQTEHLSLSLDSVLDELGLSELK